MSTLLLRLAAPMQSWGLNSKFTRRQTEREPTKSAIVGILSCALGRKRTESVNDLNALKYGVRTDQGGELLTDYQTAKRKLSDKKELAFVSHRQYLSDAIFLAGIEGDESFLNELVAAVKSPVYPLFLGRRSCPPTLPIILGIRALPLFEALKKEPYLGKAKAEQLPERLPIMLDDEAGSIMRCDLPISFSQENRRYTFRSAEVTYVSYPD
jgi:CRISPR system Cascade subunit CasD